MEITNETLNNEIDRMFNEYGIEFNDYGFNEDDTNEEMFNIIKERELDIIECNYDIDKEEAFAIRELDNIQKELRIEFYNEDTRRYDALIARRDWIRKLNTTFLCGLL